MQETEFTTTNESVAKMHLPIFEELLQKLRDNKQAFKSEEVLVADILDLQSTDLVSCQQWFASNSARQKGLELLRAGKMARLVLNGGMATRMNRGVKSLLPFKGEKSFLQLKIEGTLKFCASNYLPKPHFFLMNSPHTHQATVEFLQQHDFFGYDIQKIHFVIQEQWPRIDAQTLLPLDHFSEGYASRGHGDFLECLMQWRSKIDSWGVEWVELSNIDNLAALPNAQILGTTALNNWQMMAEIAKRKNDKGGAPLRLKNRVTVLEGPYFPAHFEQSNLSFINTNNLLFNWEFLKSSWQIQTEEPVIGSGLQPRLPWNLVLKEVAGKKVYQFEHFAIDMVRFTEPGKLGLLEVLRDWPEDEVLQPAFRFLPIKAFDDLTFFQAEVDLLYDFLHSNLNV